jgi:DNA-binding IclR family transcriptional regulator
MRKVDRGRQPDRQAAQDRNLLRSVSNALAVLSAFSVDRPEWTLTELSRELRLGKSTIFRLLTTLEAQGFVRRDPVLGRYSAGVKLWQLGCAALANTGLRQVAPTYLTKLVRLTNETAYCAILDGDYVVHVDVAVTTQPIRVHANIGDRFPAHAVGMGKVLLAYSPPEVVEHYLARNMVRFTDRTITDPDEFRAELEAIRRQGYALNRGEFEDQIRGAAAPIRNHLNQVIAAIAVAGPSIRVTEDLTKLGELVREVAEEMSLALGAAPERTWRSRDAGAE